MNAGIPSGRASLPKEMIKEANVNTEFSSTDDEKKASLYPEDNGKDKIFESQMPISPEEKGEKEKTLAPSDNKGSETYGVDRMTALNPDNLPAELLDYAKEFQKHMLYFFSSNAAHPPSSLGSLMDHILEVGEDKAKSGTDNKTKK